MDIAPRRESKVIDRTEEGVLHTLVRRELNAAGFPDCEFIQRRPNTTERGQFRTGHTIIQPDYLEKAVTAWKPGEIDMIILVVDADDILEDRDRKLKKALEIIQDKHLDHDENKVSDRSLTGLAIRDVETWLIADTDTLSKNFNLKIAPIQNLENFTETKGILNDAIEQSNYLIQENSINQRRMKIRWMIAEQINLEALKTQCPQGYRTFAENLIKTSQTTARYIDSL
jgi:hypothetical protein